MRNPTTAQKIRQVIAAGHNRLANVKREGTKLNTGTLILALQYKDGIIMAADRMVISGDSIVSMSEKKLMAIAENSVIGWAGSIDTIQLLANAYFHLLNLNGQDGEILAVRSQVELFHSLLREFFANYEDNLLPLNAIFAAVDPESGKRLVVEFSGAARIDRELFSAIGCGGDNASAAIKKYRDRKASEIGESEAIAIVFEGLVAGAQSTGVSHPRLAEPTIVLIKRNGIRDITGKVQKLRVQKLRK